MPLIVVGLNHRTAPVSLLERLAIDEDDLGKALHQLLNYEHLLEGAILSTCNRVEVYATATKFHGGAQDIRNFLAEFCHVAPEDFSDHVYTFHEEGALRHLFRVASGIDSMVVGESEILGQVKRAYTFADEEGTTGRALAAAMRHALKTGKRARTETAIGREAVSVSTAAIDLARRALPDASLTGKRVAVVGAGKMGRLTARALRGAGADRVTVLNRTGEKAEALAKEFDAVAHGLEALPQVLRETDILLCSTTSPQPVVSRDLVVGAMADRDERPLFIVDIAVPRDVDPAVGDLPNVILRDIDDLRSVVELNLGSRIGEIARVEELVAQEVDRFVAWERADELAPTIAALVEKADGVRTAELERSAARLKDLTPEQREAVDHLSRRLVAKLLHLPIKRLKDLGMSKQNQMQVAALRELFELDDEPEG